MVDRISHSPSRLPIPNSKASPKVLKNGKYGSDIVAPIVPADGTLIDSNGKENGLSSDLNCKESSFKVKPNVPSELLLVKEKGKKHTEKGFETFLMTGDMIIKTNPSLKLRKMDGSGLERHHSDSSNPFDHDVERRTFKRSASSPDQTTFTGANLNTELEDTSKTSPEEDSDENSIDKKAASAESGFEEQAVHSDTGTLEKRDKLSNDPTSVSDLSELESDDMLGTMVESQSSAVSSNISAISTPSDLRSDVSVNTVLLQEIEPLLNEDSSSSSSIEISSADSESGELSPEVIFERSMSDSGGMSPVNQTDMTKYLMASKSAEKIVVQKQARGKVPDTQIVRASKSHENYFGDEVTFVDIDIEDTAYSLDQIPCQVQKTPTKEEIPFLIQSDRSAELGQPSDESNKTQDTADDRIFMPGFIKLEDSVELESDEANLQDSEVLEFNDGRNKDTHGVFVDESDVIDSCLNSVHDNMHKEQSDFNEANCSDNVYVSKQVEGTHDQETVIVQGDLFALPPAKSVDHPSAKRLAKRLYNLDGFRKSDVSRHLSKKNDFSTIVAEEYLKFFNFTSDTLDVALRKFLKQFSLIGETQDRERVLAHFSRHYLQSNKGSFNSEDACHTLVCALMLLNTDLHGQAVGRKMTCSDFIENLSGLNDGDNFPKEILKALYHAIKADPIEWAPDEDFQDEERRTNDDQRTQQTTPPNLPSLPQVIGRNPFLDIPDPSQTTEYKKGYMMRKCCIDPDGRKTAVGKRGWKMFYVVLRDMILYLYKDEQGMKKSSTEGSHNAVRVHHSLSTKAVDYTKKQHVLRLQTADWAEYLFQTSNSKELLEWIDTLNFIAASLSAPPLPGAVGSQKKFQRPLLPASYTRHNLSEQLHSFEDRLSGTKLDLQEHRTNPPEKGSKASVIQHFLEKENYLLHEITRLETYVYLLQSKLASHTDLEPSLVETSIGEEEEGIKGVENHAPTKKSPAQRNVSDRGDPNPDSHGGVATDRIRTLNVRGELISQTTESTHL